MFICAHKNFKEICYYVIAPDCISGNVTLKNLAEDALDPLLFWAQLPPQNKYPT